MSIQHQTYRELGVSNRQQLFRSLLEHLSNTCKWSFESKTIRSIPACRFDRHQLVDSINTLVSCWSAPTFRQQRPLKLNWPCEKSIATKVIYKTFGLQNASKTVEHEAVSWEPHIDNSYQTGTEYSLFPLKGGPIGTAQQDFLCLLFLRFPLAGRDPDQSTTRTWLRSDLTLLWHCQLELVVVTWCQLVALRWAIQPIYDWPPWNGPGRVDLIRP